MTFSLNLILFPLSSAAPDGQGGGLWAVLPPAKAARRRGEERLFLHLVLQGNAPLPPSQEQALFERLTEVYYGTPGTVSGAMRAAVQALNGWLLRRNRNLAQRGQQSIGLFTIGVLRPNGLYLGQCGPIHTLIAAGEGAEHRPPSELGGRGLGVSRLPALRYQQIPLKPGDTLLLSASPAAGWSADLLAAHREQEAAALYRQLLRQPDADPRAVLIRAAAGEGDLRIAYPRGTQPLEETPRGTDSLSGEQTPEESVPPQSESVPAPPPELPPAPEAESAPKTPESPKKRARRTFPRPKLPKINLAPFLLALWDGLGRAMHNSARGAGILLARLLPEEDLGLPASWLAFMAVAVPLVVVSVAATVYYQQGKDDLYRAYYQQAEAYLAQAENAPDETARRDAWQRALDALDRAEQYQVTPESQALRRSLLANLDARDGIVRVEFQPAIYGGLTKQISVRTILPDGDALYLLDGNSGAVVRAELTSRGYQVDASFRCGPTPRVRELVDVVLLPRGNSLNAVLLGVDTDGNLLYCRVGESALEAALPSPNGNWGGPQALDFYAGNLYLLDPHPRANAVWVYPGQDASFRGLPVFFFDNEIPPLERAVDMVRTPDDLFLLYADGHLTRCTVGRGGAETRCADPAPLRDDRPEGEAKPAFAGAHFAAIQYVSPPDPALYLLDDARQAVYLFSLQLRFLRQYRSLYPLEGSAPTAFAVDHPSRRLFLALGNEVYYTVLP